jgi:tetratricopeptide (TPR) repeat protein
MRLLLGILSTLLLSTPALAQASGGSPNTSEEVLRRYLDGRLLEEQGARAEALDQYFRALALDPQAIDIARRISEVAGQMGDPGRSLEFAERALKIRSDDPRSLWLKGAALLNMGRESDAIGPLQAAADADSDKVEYFRTLARAAERLDRFDVVMHCYQRVIWLDDEDGEAWFQLAAAQARLGLFGAADTSLVTAVHLNPLRPGLFFLQGWISESLGHLDQAREGYRQHLTIHPDDQGTRRRLIFLLARQKRFKEAAREATVLAEGRGDDLEVRHMQAELLFEAGESAQGLRLLDQLKRERPDDEDVVSIRVGILARHGRGHAAVEEAERWLKDHPAELRSRLLAARARELNGDLEKAAAHLSEAVAQEPDSIVPRVLLARVRESAHQLPEAEKVWSQAVTRFPGQDALAFDLALCREKLGDLEGAERAVRDVLAREPENPTALNFLGYLFADHNRNLDEAVRLIQRALQFEPENGAFLDSLGWAYFRLGRLSEARVALEKAIQRSGSDAIIHEHLGDVYKGLQLNELAKGQYRLSLASDGDNGRVREKLSRIR